MIYSLKLLFLYLKQFTCVFTFSHLCVMSQGVMFIVYTYVNVKKIYAGPPSAYRPYRPIRAGLAGQ
jgi:hypothetical protein